jgi:hypothetical protein
VGKAEDQAVIIFIVMSTCEAARGFCQIGKVANVNCECIIAVIQTLVGGRVYVKMETTLMDGWMNTIKRS